jgi:hypothetical protein
MTRDELIEQLKTTFLKTKIDKLSKIVKEQNFDLHDLIDLTFHEDKMMAFRAAWLLENMLLVNPVSYLPVLDHLLEKFQQVQYPSCQRHYAKIIMHLTSAKAHPLIRQKIAETDMEPVVEKCFDWMIDPLVLIAVKRFSAEALFNMRHRYDWIADELAQQVQYLMQDGTAAIQTYGKKLLTILEQEKKI